MKGTLSGEFKLKEALRLAESQQGALAQNRTSAGQLLSGLLVSAALLAPLALTGRTGLPKVAWFGLGPFVVALLACAFVFVPREFHLTTDGSVFEHEGWECLSDDAASAHLARRLTDAAKRNEKTLDQVATALVIALAAACVSIAGWLLAVARYH